jgi:hypothetical protein
MRIDSTASSKRASQVLKAPINNSCLQKNSGAPYEPHTTALPSAGRITSLSYPKPLVTAGRLPPQILRTQHGTINVRSSGSIIVDLREGERMKGRKGDFVLEVSSDGQNVRRNSSKWLRRWHYTGWRPFRTIHVHSILTAEIDCTLYLCKNAITIFNGVWICGELFGDG